MARFERNDSSSRYSDQRHPGNSMVHMTNLMARVTTFICVLVALVIQQTNHVTLKNGVKINFNYSSIFLSYKCIFFASVAGLAYTLVQIPFALHRVRHKRRLIEHWCFPHIDFYCDKIVSLLLGVAGGAAFGGTIDLNIPYQPCDETNTHQIFGTKGYVMTGSVLAGCLTTVISSIFSSLDVSVGA